jgi:hypothetical protein
MLVPSATSFRISPGGRYVVAGTQDPVSLTQTDGLIARSVPVAQRTPPAMRAIKLTA